MTPSCFFLPPRSVSHSILYERTELTVFRSVVPHNTGARTPILTTLLVQIRSQRRLISSLETAARTLDLKLITSTFVFNKETGAKHLLHFKDYLQVLSAQCYLYVQVLTHFQLSEYDAKKVLKAFKKASSKNQIHAFWSCMLMQGAGRSLHATELSSMMRRWARSFSCKETREPKSRIS